MRKKMRKRNDGKWKAENKENETAKKRTENEKKEGSKTKQIKRKKTLNAVSVIM